MVLSLLAPAPALVNPFAPGTALSAQKSTLTGIVYRDTLTASLYWTMDLKNSSGTDGEAQAELRIPEGGVVSRATLWVNGVPQEAAFNTTGRVMRMGTATKMGMGAADCRLHPSSIERCQC